MTTPKRRAALSGDAHARKHAKGGIGDAPNEGMMRRLPDEEVTRAAEQVLIRAPARRQQGEGGGEADAGVKEERVQAVERIVRAVRRAHDGDDDVVVRGMCSYVKNWCTSESSFAFVEEILPAALRGIADVRRLAAEGELDLLREGRAACVQVGRQLAHALLSCALFGVCKSAAGFDWPYFSMEPLWRVVDNYDVVRAKIACQLAYHHEAFRRDNFAEDSQPIRFTRKVLVDGFDEEVWLNSTTPLGEFRVIHHGANVSIGTAPNHVLRADFANASLGGGVWSRGAVQEEILFSEEPELCVGMLLAQDLGDRESLHIEHSMRYSTTIGYSATLQFAKPLHPPESYGPVIAMDAIEFRDSFRADKTQYTTHSMVRELCKSLCAFLPCESALVGGDRDDAAEASLIPPVATGNWGCGAFGGDPQLKALLQWLSASTACRPIDYYTHTDARVANRLDDDLVRRLRSRYATVGGLFTALSQFDPHHHGRASDLFDWLSLAL